MFAAHLLRKFFQDRQGRHHFYRRGECEGSVEDQEDNQRILRDLLTHAGYEFSLAETGLDGVVRAAAERPDLILMDIQLPGMDGLEALEHLRADGDTASIPVAALTAYAMTDDRERLLAAGFDAYLEKPITARDLPGQVAALLDRDRMEARE